MRAATPVVAALAALLLGAGCSSPSAPAAPVGRRLSEGAARSLAASLDGGRVAWLSACVPSPGAPKGLLTCSLLVAPVAGGPSQRVADGVAAVDGAFAWGADGSLAALGHRDAATGAGDLTVLRPGGEVRVVAPRVASFAWGPASGIAFAAGGDLLVASTDGAPRAVRGGTGVSDLAFAPAPGRALAALVRGPGGARNLAFWREAGGEPTVVARDVASFAFSPDGGALAAIAGVAPGSAGNLVVVQVGPDGQAPSSATAVARAVGEFRWAPAASRLAWLEDFDPRIHAGTLASALPGGTAVSFAPRVTAFELAPAGDQVAFVRHLTDGGYAASLEISPSGAAAANAVTRDPASFEFSTEGRWLYYRSGCAPAGESCVLFRAPAAGAGLARSPERLADGVTGFVLDRWRPDRALVSLARRDGAGVDLAIWSGGKLVALDGNVLAGSPRFLPPEGRRVAYVVALPARAGVYVTEVP